MNRNLVKILIIDDDPRIVEVFSAILTEAGYSVVAAFNGSDGLRLVFDERPDLILLDIRLPGMDGFQVLDILRTFNDVPVIMLTAVGHDANRIRGMEKDATDLLPKNTDSQVLLAIIENRLRTHAKRAPLSGLRWIDDSLQIDLAGYKVRYNGEPINLTPLQWRILRCLVEHEGHITTFRDLFRAGWQDPDLREISAVKVQISQLRRKLHDNSRDSRYIHTVRSEGYLFEAR